MESYPHHTKKEQEMKLVVRITQDDSSKHTWTPTILLQYLAGIMRSRGTNLCIHASDGTKIEVYPKCEKCGNYNLVRPMIDGLCEGCRINRKGINDRKRAGQHIRIRAW